MVVQDLEDFLVFELEKSGEKKQIKDISQQNLQSLLHSKQVLVIVRRDLKRIFIWKGSASPVQKRFISSRVAATIRQELSVGLKVVSVDQGDELKEFLDAFQLESMPVTETLEDMRYERNTEKKEPSPEIIGLASKIKTSLKDGALLDKKKENVKDGTSAIIPKNIKNEIFNKIKVINRLIVEITEILEKN
jgi:hypothetical protein